MKISVGSVLRVKKTSLEVYSQPVLSTNLIVCHLCSNTYVTCIDIHHHQTALWICTSSGWILTYSNPTDEPSLVEDDVSKAEKSWEEEKELRYGMASAVASALIRTYSLPRAKRLARSIAKHGEQHYPHGSLVKVSSVSMEDIMISLGGKHGLGKQEIFEFIKAAASRQSSPRHAVFEIAKEVYRIFTDRPSTWVVDNLNVIVTEDIRIDNNRFVMAAAEGNVSEFKAFLAHGQDLTCLHSDLRYTALHAAADFGQLDVLNVIIEAGMSVNVRHPTNGQTALHYAAYGGRPEVVKRLIEAGADRTVKCNKGILPYEASFKQGHEESADILKFPPPSVQKGSITEVDINSMMISWKPPILHKIHHAPLLEYAVAHYSEDTVYDQYDKASLIYLPHSVTTCKVSGLLPSTTYKVRIKCRTASGWSDWSNWFKSTTLPYVPNPPAPIEVVKVSINSFYLRWKVPDRTNGYDVNMYELEIMDENLCKQQSTAMESLANKKSLFVERLPVDSTLALDSKQRDKGQQRNIDLFLGGEQLESGENNGGVSKVHRIIKHRDVNQLTRYITGLDPNRAYVIRVRASNRLGFGAYSAWCRAVTPEHGVHIDNDFNTLTHTVKVKLTWFSPVLNPEHCVFGYELQLCKVQGPILTEHKSALNKIHNDVLVEKEVDGRVVGRRGLESDPMNEFFTISNSILTNEYILDGLKAGTRYKCRVRPNIKIVDEKVEKWIDWEHSLTSEPFNIPATIPDPPLNVLPDVEPVYHITFFQNPDKDSDKFRVNTESHLAEELDGTEDEISALAPDTIQTIVNSSNYSVLNRSNAAKPIYISPGESGAVEDKRTRELLGGSNIMLITHNSIYLVWKAGDCNGLPILGVEVERALIRTYNSQDLLSLSVLLINEEAYEGMRAGDTQSSVKMSKRDEKGHNIEDDVDSYSDSSDLREESLPLSSSPSLINYNELDWINITTTGGRFLSSQSFLATGLQSGRAYCFRIRQCNKLGWSIFSPPSPVIGTYPSSPPANPTAVFTNQTLAIICFEVSTELTSLEFEVQFRQFSLTSNESFSGTLASEQENYLALSQWEETPARVLSEKEVQVFSRSSSKIITAQVREKKAVLQERDYEEIEREQYGDLLDLYHDDEDECKEGSGPARGETDGRVSCTDHSKSYVLVNGLVEGQHYAVRVRRRTVVGWSPFSTTSRIFRTMR